MIRSSRLASELASLGYKKSYLNPNQTKQNKTVGAKETAPSVECVLSKHRELILVFILSICGGVSGGSLELPDQPA